MHRVDKCSLILLLHFPIVKQILKFCEVLQKYTDSPACFCEIIHIILKIQLFRIKKTFVFFPKYPKEQIAPKSSEFSLLFCVSFSHEHISGFCFVNNTQINPHFPAAGI